MSHFDPPRLRVVPVSARGDFVAGCLLAAIIGLLAALVWRFAI